MERPPRQLAGCPRTAGMNPAVTDSPRQRKPLSAEDLPVSGCASVAVPLSSLCYSTGCRSPRHFKAVFLFLEVDKGSQEFSKPHQCTPCFGVTTCSERCLPGEQQVQIFPMHPAKSVRLHLDADLTLPMQKWEESSSPIRVFCQPEHKELESDNSSEHFCLVRRSMFLAYAFNFC